MGFQVLREVGIDSWGEDGVYNERQDIRRWEFAHLENEILMDARFRRPIWYLD